MIYSITPADAILFDQISQWARERGWSVELATTDEDIMFSGDRSERKALLIGLDSERQVYLEPSGRRKDGTEIVDVFAVPTLARARLLLRPSSDQWEMVTDMGVPFHHPWNASNFLRLVEDLVAV